MAKIFNVIFLEIGKSITCQAVKFLADLLFLLHIQYTFSHPLYRDVIISMQCDINRSWDNEKLYAFIGQTKSHISVMVI